MEAWDCPTAESTEAVGAELAKRLVVGDVLLLFGELGAGKTTLTRGYLRALGWMETVRSPTFSLLQVYETEPPVLHADLYRLSDSKGLGLEEYFETHVCLIEWPERLQGLIDESQCWRLVIQPQGDGRRIVLTAPGEA